MAAQKQLQVLFSTSPVMEQLAFGIRPAGYDNGYNVGIDRPDYFGDPHVRQAVAMCIDRQKVVDTVLNGLSQVPSTFVPAEDPLYNSIATTYSYDVAAANTLLQNAGWLDIDNDPSTARQAWGVQNVPDGTRFEINYITTAAAQRVQVSSSLADSLAQCGIKVNIDYLDQAVLYAAGPDGLLFGRNFDLAEFAMGSTGRNRPVIGSAVPRSRTPPISGLGRMSVVIAIRLTMRLASRSSKSLPMSRIMQRLIARPSPFFLKICRLSLSIGG